MLFWPKPKKSYILHRKGERDTQYIWHFILLPPSTDCDFKKGKIQREGRKNHIYFYVFKTA